MAICYRVASDGKEPTSETTGEVAGAITAEASERIGKDIASGILRLLPVAKAVIAEAKNVIEVAIIGGPKSARSSWASRTSSASGMVEADRSSNIG